MARNKATLNNIDNSDPSNYLNGRIKDNSGSGNGTPVNEFVYGDLHQTLAKLMDLAGLAYNGLPDNESNGYQLVDAIRQLASKNDLNYELSRSGSVLSLPLKIGKLVDKEVVRAISTINKGSETQIKGTLDNVNKTVTYLGDFKQNEYVRLINLSGSIVIIREVDAFNLGQVCTELGFLKAANNSETLSGNISNKAVTPQSFLNAFFELINGSESSNYLAGSNRNGLLSSAQQQIIANLGSPALKNRGSYVHGRIRTSPIGTNFVSDGDISAEKTGQTQDGDEVTITFDNSMNDINYRLDVSIEGLGDPNFANDLHPIVFKKIDTNSAKLFLERTTSLDNNLKIHVDVIQL